MAGRRYVVALAEDAARAIRHHGTLVVDQLPGVVLIETDVSVATTLVQQGQYVSVYTSLEAAHRVFALFHHED